jgi:hypothetical protein
VTFVITCLAGVGDAEMRVGKVLTAAITADSHVRFTPLEVFQLNHLTLTRVGFLQKSEGGG